MQYISTRTGGSGAPSSRAIVQGLAADGGLFVPQSFPRVEYESVLGCASYAELSAKIMGVFLTDYTEAELREITAGAYGEQFTSPLIAPVAKLSESCSVLELFHGPTLAFKDMALQALPRLMPAALKKTGETRKVFILVATSGDTGKAALEGFKDVEGTAISVFYPVSGVSDAQRRQMVTQEGSNVHVCAVEGNFDDAQTGVKRIFSDDEFASRIDQNGYVLSSANSINWGRLVPQIAYYYHAYCELVKSGRISAGEQINFCVPTGNFGNILAGYYAKRMGLPVNKLICASNSNNVLCDFFGTGVYDRNREFFKTSSPSMDILISSNLERLLFEAADRDPAKVMSWMDSLKARGSYEVGQEIGSKLKDEFFAAWSDDTRSNATLARIFKERSYLMDTHTAVAQCAYEDYVEATGDCRHTVIVSTASAFKFAPDVLSAIEPNRPAEKDEFAYIDALSKLTGQKVPDALAQLAGKPSLHTGVCKKEDMARVVLAQMA